MALKSTLSERILQLVKERPGLSDREISDVLALDEASQQDVNQACKFLETRDAITRRKRPDGRIANYPPSFAASTKAAETAVANAATVAAPEPRSAVQPKIADEGTKPVVTSPIRTASPTLRKTAPSKIADEGTRPAVTGGARTAPVAPRRGVPPKISGEATKPAVAGVPRVAPVAPPRVAAPKILGEAEIKEALENWLKSHGWTSKIASGRGGGADITAQRGMERWIIEAKGEGPRELIKQNYFLAVLGELLQEMKEPMAKYSVALPDTGQFRKLWNNLPPVAKQRTGITALFVSANGAVEEVTQAGATTEI